MVGKCQNITEKVCQYLYKQENQKVSTSLILLEFGHLTACKKHVVTILSQLHKEMANLYRVDQGTYIFSRSRKYKEYTGRYNQIIELAQQNNGMVTLDQIIETCIVTKTQAYTMLDQLKRGSNTAPTNVKVQRQTYYHIEVVEEETADV